MTDTVETNQISDKETDKESDKETEYESFKESDNDTLLIDFILAFDSQDTNPANLEKRQVFESKLRGEGLQLEYDTEQNIHFVKIRAPRVVLCRYAEILKFKFPLNSVPNAEFAFERDLKVLEKLMRCCLKLLWRRRYENPEPRFFYEFSRARAELFDLADPNFFDTGVRNNIVNFILERQYFVKDEEIPPNMGIEKLLEDKVYVSAYPLHNASENSKLRNEWGSLKKCLSLQPLEEVYDYFGAKVTMYYAWLGFYLIMLVPLSIFGIVCFIYGLATLPTDPISHDICQDNRTSLMCPQCDRNCDFWQLKNTCDSSRMNYLLDNAVTIVFTFAMSIWAVAYLALWKQYSAKLIHSWGLTGFSQHVVRPRPRYLARLYEQRTLALELNVANNSFEPVLPFWRLKFLPSLISYSILVLFICVSLITLFALIVYRMAQRASYHVLGDSKSSTNKILVLPITAGILDLIVITVLNEAYKRLAILLTDLEYHRTQTEYEQSLTIKNYLFQFVNYYASLFYIAFIKNKFVGYPGKYNRLFGFRQEECNPGGCLMELCLQLVIIMVGKQVARSLIQISLPYAMYIFRLFCLCKKQTKVKLKAENPWTRDYNLEKFTKQSMYQEYLDMVIQYGFIVFFGLAFPLAPLLALINNIFELRLDAIKHLKLVQRPVASRVSSIGVWYPIMEILTKIAVFTNAIIIAFCTNFIPKLVYIVETGDKSLNGFLDFTLSKFDTKDFELKPQIDESQHSNVHICHYSDYRNPPEHERPYGRPIHYWYIWIGRLAFIVIYQNVIGLLQSVVSWAIPDVSGKLKRRIEREEFISMEYILHFEKESAVQRDAER